MTSAEINAVVEARTTLGALAPAVEAIADAAADAAKYRPGQNGDMDALNLRMPDGKTAAAWFAKVEAFMSGQSPSAPVVTAKPTLSVGPQGIIQSDVIDKTTAATSHVITFTSPLVAGHAGVAGFLVELSNSITGITDNLGDAWTKAVETNGGSNAYQVWTRVGVPTGVESITVQLGGSSTLKGAWYERDDISSTDPIDQTAAGTFATGATFTSPSTAALDADGIAVGLVGTLDNGTSTFSGTGWSDKKEIGGSPGYVASMAWKATTNGSTPAFSGSIGTTNASGRAAIVAFHKVTGGGGVNVGDDVTITPGAVTNGLGGAHSNEFQVFGVDTLGVETSVLTLTAASGATKAFKVGAQLYGKRIKISQVAVDSTTGVRSNAMASDLTAVVGGTLPSNSTAPSLSPTGSQASGTELTLSAGTWSGAAELGFQVTVDSVPVGGRVFQTGTSFAVPTNDTYVGKAVSGNVVGRSSLGLDSAPVNSSNSVTITGSAPAGAITYTSAPTWPADLFIEQTADFTDGVVASGTTSDGPGWDFYRNGKNPENLMPRPVLYPSLNAHNSVSLFTPRTSEGVAVGDTIYILEKRRGTDGNIYSIFSAGKSVAAAPALLTITPSNGAQAGYVFTAGLAITPQVVGTITGGTTPYNVNQPLQSIGLTLAVQGSDVVMSGTPSVSVTTPNTISVTDSGGSAAATMSVTITVNASGVTPASALVFSQASPAISGANTTYDGVNAKFFNGQVVLGPNGDGRARYRLINGSPLIAGGVRAESLWFSETLVPGESVCFGWDLKFDLLAEYPAASTGDDQFLVMQSHTPLSGNTQPDIACFVARQDNQIKWRIAGNDAAPVSGTQTTKTPQPGYFGAQTLAQGRRYRFAIEMVPGYLSSHGPRIDIWIRNDNATSWTKLVDNYTTLPNTYNGGGGSSNLSYFRIGWYKWVDSVWNNASISGVMSPLFLVRGAGQIARVQAALDALAP